MTKNEADAFFEKAERGEKWEEIAQFAIKHNWHTFTPIRDILLKHIDEIDTYYQVRPWRNPEYRGFPRTESERPFPYGFPDYRTMRKANIFKELYKVL